METGGGKTFVACAAALIKALRGTDGIALLLAPTVGVINQHVAILTEVANLCTDFSIQVVSDRSDALHRHCDVLTQALCEKGPFSPGKPSFRLVIGVMLPETYLHLNEVGLGGAVHTLIMDECHTWDSWSAFRPLERFQLIQAKLHDALIICVSPCNPPSTRRALTALFGLRDTAPVIGTVRIRDNLRFIVWPRDRLNAILRTILDLSNFPAFWYVNTYESGTRLFELAQKWKFSGLFDQEIDLYFGQYSEEHKSHVLDEVQAGRKGVVIASKSLGLGIDAKIRCVVIFDDPDSLDDLYNAAGRAGRDGEPARCFFLHGSKPRSSCSLEYLQFVGDSYEKPKSAKFSVVCSRCGDVRCRPVGALADPFCCDQIGVACTNQTCLQVMIQRYLEGVDLLTPSTKRANCICSVCMPLELSLPIDDGSVVVNISESSKFSGSRGRVVASTASTVTGASVNVLYASGRHHVTPILDLVRVTPQDGDTFSPCRMPRGSRPVVDEDLKINVLSTIAQVAAVKHTEVVELVSMEVVNLLCSEFPANDSPVWHGVDESLKTMLVPLLQSRRPDPVPPPMSVPKKRGPPSKSQPKNTDDSNDDHDVDQRALRNIQANPTYRQMHKK